MVGKSSLCPQWRCIEPDLVGVLLLSIVWIVLNLKRIRRIVTVFEIIYTNHSDIF